MARQRRTTGSTKTSDDTEGRRSIIVPDELWAHVTRRAEQTNQKEAAVVRDWIARVAEERIAESQAIDSLHSFTETARSLLDRLQFVYESLTRLQHDAFMKGQFEDISTHMAVSYELMQYIEQFVITRFRRLTPMPENDDPMLPLPRQPKRPKKP